MAKKDFSGITNIPSSEYLKHDYYRTVINYLRGKIILDVGCIDDGTEGANEIRLWNHWFLHKICKRVIGIDLREVPLGQLKKMGFNVKKMDAQEISFREKFDVVFAGELIEHLPNPGLFLMSAANVLAENGMVILSTPNPFSLNRLVRVFQSFTNEPAVNPDHTMYISPQNIRTLARKCNLKVVKIEYAHFPFSRPNWLIALNQIGCRIIGERFKEQMIIFIRKRKK